MTDSGPIDSDGEKAVNGVTVAPTETTGRTRNRRGRARRRITRVGGMLVLLAVLGTLYATLAPGSNNAAASDNAAVTAGKALYAQGCASCHGLTGQGSDQGVSLEGVGAAAADFQVGARFMPLIGHGPEAVRHRQRYTPDQIQDIADYVATFGPGPQIPTNLDYSQTDGAVGGALFRTNCAQCHNFEGAGGALPHGQFAPSLSGVQPKYIYEAMLTGPENMPVFGNQQITPAQKLAIINYVETVQSEPNPGGVSLGRVGPVTEGLVAWVGGIGILVLSVIWIGSRS